jgi:transcriptional regulator with XRE-family HTH domain
MEVFEVINNILTEKKITKREFATKLIALEPKSNRTGEIISENIIYSYLSGQTAIKAYLIPYIAEVLDIPEQLLFEENEKTRLKILSYILANLSEKEKSLILNTVTNTNIDANNDTRYKDIVDLLDYAPTPFLNTLKSSLKEFKSITDKMNKPI